MSYCKAPISGRVGAICGISHSIQSTNRFSASAQTKARYSSSSKQYSTTVSILDTSQYPFQTSSKLQTSLNFQKTERRKRNLGSNFQANLNLLPGFRIRTYTYPSLCTVQNHQSK
ncbi:Hypothetical_protein [Hexamita inflata]|uniref:Hypothetical_protein n=1 Tax=Hexamita inflata TaxID=28002 RepID=A0AA86Q5M4_9EUKA|nr:Hypothetical protein HINF_LOCUS39268 [Hexamita inflata]